MASKKPSLLKKMWKVLHDSVENTRFVQSPVNLILAKSHFWHIFYLYTFIALRVTPKYHFFFSCMDEAYVRDCCSVVTLKFFLHGTISVKRLFCSLNYNKTLKQAQRDRHKRKVLFALLTRKWTPSGWSLRLRVPSKERTTTLHACTSKGYMDRSNWHADRTVRVRRSTRSLVAPSKRSSACEGED